MNGIITFLLLGLITLVGLTQNGSIPKTPGYVASGILGALILILGIVRYSNRKKAGE